MPSFRALAPSDIGLPRDRHSVTHNECSTANIDSVRIRHYYEPAAAPAEQRASIDTSALLSQGDVWPRFDRLKTSKSWASSGFECLAEAPMGVPQD